MHCSNCGCCSSPFAGRSSRIGVVVVILGDLTRGSERTSLSISIVVAAGCALLLAHRFVERSLDCTSNRVAPPRATEPGFFLRLAFAEAAALIGFMVDIAPRSVVGLLHRGGFHGRRFCTTRTDAAPSLAGSRRPFPSRMHRSLVEPLRSSPATGGNPTLKTHGVSARVGDESDSFAAARADLERLVALRSRQRQCSIAWGVVADGELVLTGAHAAEPDPLPTEHTVFRIASMTKSFTASSILMLRDSGLAAARRRGCRHRPRVRRRGRSDDRLAARSPSATCCRWPAEWRPTMSGPIAIST